ncbi:prepilin peptidase [Gordonia spumicola]|nr:A24 family peptidase [Gordonia spumicola]
MVVGGLIVVLVWCAVSDARTGRIPNTVTLPAIGVVAVLATLEPAVAWGAAVCAAPYLIAFARRLCGGADVKLAVVCGGVLADPASAAAVVVGSAVITGCVLAVRRRTVVVHGPALVSTTLAWLVIDSVAASGTIDACCVG